MVKYRSNEAWQELFAEYEASPESARDFCARHGLRLVYFYRRSWELRGRSARREEPSVKPTPPAPPTAAFVPVTISPRNPQAAITITVGKGTLVLSSSVPPAWVAALLTALEG